MYVYAYTYIHECVCVCVPTMLFQFVAVNRETDPLNHLSFGTPIILKKNS